jgi:hypothetical protein
VEKIKVFHCFLLFPFGFRWGSMRRRRTIRLVASSIADRLQAPVPQRETKKSVENLTFFSRSAASDELVFVQTERPRVDREAQEETHTHTHMSGSEGAFAASLSRSLLTAAPPDIDKHVLRRYEVLQKLGKGVRENRSKKKRAKNCFFSLEKKMKGEMCSL